MSTGPAALDFGAVRQLGYVVADLDREVKQWTATQRVGPWMILRNVEMPCTYRGQPSRPLIDLALAFRGEQQVELIQQKNDAPSPYREYIAARRYGLHHHAFLSRDISADVARGVAAGLELVCDIRMPGGGGRYVYFAAPGSCDHAFIELLDANWIMRGMFAVGIRRARQWRGGGRPLDLNLGPVLRLMRGLG